jgi:leader peptidase (prepilin peptidase)/N-methyltransferase
VLAPVGVLLAVVDFAAHRLPDALTLPLAAAALVLLGGAAVVPGADGSWTSALPAPSFWGPATSCSSSSAGDFGFGDVKLAFTLGAVLGWCGWAIVLIGTFAGCLLGALYGVALIFGGRAGRAARIPFGPFLLAGAFGGVLLGSCTR